MKLPESSNNNTLGARRLPNNFQNNSFNDPTIQTEGPRGNGYNSAGFDNPFSQFTENPMMRNMAGNIIKDQVSKHTEGYSSYFSFDIVRPYFHIDNSYILKKFKLIFLPILQRGDWKITGAEDYMGSKMEYENYKTNIEKIDPFSVDLYLPIMSLITLTLVVGFYYGAMEMFDPAILGYIVGKGCFIWLLEAIVIKVAFALQGVPSAPFMDLL